MKTLRLATVLIALTSAAIAQKTPWFDVALKSTGAPAAAATVRVCTNPSAPTGSACLPLATLYSNKTGTVGTNPVSADSVGNFSFYADPGYYDVNVTSGSSTYSYTIFIGNNSDQATFSNNVFLQWKDSGGTLRNVLGLTSGNVTQINGTAAVHQVVIKPDGSTTTATFDSTGATLTGTTTLTAASAATVSASTSYSSTTNRTYIKQGMVRAVKTATQSIPSATFTTLTWDNEAYDTDGWHDNVTLNSRITVPITGKYRVSAALDFVAVASTTQKVCRIMKNGVLLSSGGGTGNASGDAWANCYDVVPLSAGDYLEVQAYQDTGGAQNIGTSSFFIVELAAIN